MVEGTRRRGPADAGRQPRLPGRPARHDGDRATGQRRGSEVPLRGSWFTEAFEGPMSNLQRFVAGEDRHLVSPVARRDQDDGAGRGVLPVERAAAARRFLTRECLTRRARTA